MIPSWSRASETAEVAARTRSIAGPTGPSLGALAPTVADDSLCCLSSTGSLVSPASRGGTLGQRIGALGAAL
jgi:hypothetical protein